MKSLKRKLLSYFKAEIDEIKFELRDMIVEELSANLEARVREGITSSFKEMKSEKKKK